MKRKLIGLAAASTLLCSAMALAQSSDRTKSFTHGESKRCAALSGDEKALCDKEEATKTQGSAAQEPSGSSAAAGGSAQPKESANTSGKGTQSWSSDSPQPGSTPSGITPD